VLPRQADDDAKNFLHDNFLTEIVEALISDGEASDDINNDYPNGDGLFHEEITSKEYSPEEAIAVLEYYSEFEETDSGLWDGVKNWRQMLSAMAAYTYSNAVMSKICDLFNEINSIDVDDVRAEILRLLEIQHEREQTKLADEDENYEAEEFNADAQDIRDDLTARLEGAVLSIIG